MFGQSLFYDVILYVYALSLLFMFSDFVERNPRAKRLGTGLLAFVWVLQTLFLLYEGAKLSEGSLFVLLSSLLFFSWLIVTMSLVLNYVMRVDAVFFVNVAGFAAAALTFLGERTLSGTVLTWNVRHELLAIHVTLAVGSYAAYLFSALFSVMLLFLNNRLKGKRWSERLTRLPSLDDIQKWALRFVMIGTPLLLLSLVLGLVWVTFGRDWRLFGDWKIINSLLVIIVYGYYLWQRYRGNLNWSQLAGINLIGFALVASNVILSNIWSQFH